MARVDKKFCGGFFSALIVWVWVWGVGCLGWGGGGGGGCGGCGERWLGGEMGRREGGRGGGAEGDEERGR